MGDDRRWLVDAAERLPLTVVAERLGVKPRSCMNQLRRLGVEVEQAGPNFQWFVRKASFDEKVGVEVR